MPGTAQEVQAEGVSLQRKTQRGMGRDSSLEKKHGSAMTWEEDRTWDGSEMENRRTGRILPPGMRQVV